MQLGIVYESIQKEHMRKNKIKLLLSFLMEILSLETFVSHLAPEGGFQKIARDGIYSLGFLLPYCLCYLSRVFFLKK